MVSYSNPFRMAVCRGILDTDAHLVGVFETKGKAKGLLGLRRKLGYALRGAWPRVFTKLSFEPLYALLHENKVKCLYVPGARDPQFTKTLMRLQPDLIVLSRFGEILPPEALGISELGIVNIHCSLLPQLRGATPIPGAIIGKFSESGVTIHFVDEGIDTGDIILQRRMPLDAAETQQSFCEKAAQLMRPMIAEVIRMFMTGNVRRVRQDSSNASYFSINRVFGSDGVQVDWSQPSWIIEAFVRAGVKCFTSYKGVRFRIWKAHLAPSWAQKNPLPGVILARTRGGLVVGTLDTPLEIAVSPVRTRRWWSVTDTGECQPRANFLTKRQLLPVALAALTGRECLESRDWPPVSEFLPSCAARDDDDHV